MSQDDQNASPSSPIDKNRTAVPDCFPGDKADDKTDRNVCTTLRFLPENRSIEITEPIILPDAAAACDILIEQPCGGKARCAKCLVRFCEGAPQPAAADLRLIPPDKIAEGWRLSCQCRIETAAVIEVPTTERAPDAKSFGPTDLFEGQMLEPIVRMVPFNLPPPSLDAQDSDLDALQKSDGDNPHATPGRWIEASTGCLNTLHDNLEAIGKTGEATVYYNRLIDVSVTGMGARYGLAIDVGSTTLAEALVELETGRVVAAGAELNPQSRFGADVIARISYAMEHPEGNRELHDAVCRALSELCQRLCRQADVAPDRIAAAALCGNPSMTHWVAGVDARSLGKSPYVGAFTRNLTLSPKELNLPIHPEGAVWIFPQIRSHVGGDAVSGAMAVRMDEAEQPILFIDLGTNSEILLGCRDGILAASTSAGPAFEGQNISCGMRAAPGAVDRVSLEPDGELLIRVLGKVPARGVCGSGLVDAAAALLDAGAIDASGRLLGPGEYSSTTHPRLRERLSVTPEGRREAILVPSNPSTGQRPVALNDLDIRALQLVKGSIRAGCEVLMQERGITASDLGGVYLAGAFGNYLRKAGVMRIGLVPEVDAEKIVFVGNTAGVGARIALMDAAARRRARRIAENASYLELGSDPRYLDAFAESMQFDADI